MVGVITIEMIRERSTLNGMVGFNSQVMFDLRELLPPFLFQIRTNTQLRVSLVILSGLFFFCFYRNTSRSVSSIDFHNNLRIPYMKAIVERELSVLVNLWVLSCVGTGSTYKPRWSNWVGWITRWAETSSRKCRSYKCMQNDIILTIILTYLCYYFALLIWWFILTRVILREFACFKIVASSITMCIRNNIKFLPTFK